MKISVLSLKEKTTQHWFSCFQNACKYFKSFDWPVIHIIYDDFSIWLL